METAILGYIGIVEKKMENTIIGLCRDSGKENGNCYNGVYRDTGKMETTIIGVCRESGKENANCYSGVYRDTGKEHGNYYQWVL